MRDYFEGMALGFLIGVIACGVLFYVMATLAGGN